MAATKERTATIVLKTGVKKPTIQVVANLDQPENYSASTQVYISAEVALQRHRIELPFKMCICSTYAEYYRLNQAIQDLNHKRATKALIQTVLHVRNQVRQFNEADVQGLLWQERNFCNDCLSIVLLRRKLFNEPVVLLNKPKESVCSACTKSLKTRRNIKRCSVCKSAAYCGKECQADHWPEHKVDCLPHRQIVTDKSTHDVEFICNQTKTAQTPAYFLSP